MGRGGISFRAPRARVAVLCAALAGGCRTSASDEDLRVHLEVGPQGLASDGAGGFVVGHRFGRWLEVEPEGPASATLEQACRLEQVGASEEAIELLGEALEEVRGCASLFEARGALYLSTGFPRAAVGDFQRAVALTPEQPRGWFALGHAYEILGLTRQSLEALEHAHALGGDEPGLHLSLARVYRQLGRVGSSARHYAAALERLEGPRSEIQLEVLLLATGDEAHAVRVQELCERLETCRGLQLSDDAWLLRALLRELPGETPEEIGATFRALEVAPAELAKLTEGLLLTLQLLDAETADAASKKLLGSERDPERRARLERCLAHP